MAKIKKDKKQLKKKIKQLKRDLKQTRANVSRLLIQNANLAAQLDRQETAASWANDKTQWGL